MKTSETGALRPGFVYTTTEAATLLGKPVQEVRRMCDTGELWTFRARELPGWPRRIALDIHGTERLLGHSTAKSRRAARRPPMSGQPDGRRGGNAPCRP